MKRLHKKVISREMTPCSWLNPDAMSGRTGGRVVLLADIHASLDNAKDAKDVMERWERTVNEFVESMGEEAVEMDRGPFQ